MKKYLALFVLLLVSPLCAADAVWQVQNDPDVLERYEQVYGGSLSSFVIKKAPLITLTCNGADRKYRLLKSAENKGLEDKEALVLLADDGLEKSLKKHTPIDHHILLYLPANNELRTTSLKSQKLSSTPDLRWILGWGDAVDATVTFREKSHLVEDLEINITPHRRDLADPICQSLVQAVFGRAPNILPENLTAALLTALSSNTLTMGDGNGLPEVYHFAPAPYSFDEGAVTGTLLVCVKRSNPQSRGAVRYFDCILGGHIEALQDPIEATYRLMNSAIEIEKRAVAYRPQRVDENEVLLPVYAEAGTLTSPFCQLNQGDTLIDVDLRTPLIPLDVDANDYQMISFLPPYSRYFSHLMIKIGDGEPFAGRAAAYFAPRSEAIQLGGWGFKRASLCPDIKAYLLDEKPRHSLMIPVFYDTRRNELIRSTDNQPLPDEPLLWASDLKTPLVLKDPNGQLGFSQEALAQLIVKDIARPRRQKWCYTVFVKEQPGQDPTPVRIPYTRGESVRIGNYQFARVHQCPATSPSSKSDTGHQLFLRVQGKGVSTYFCPVLSLEGGKCTMLDNQGARRECEEKAAKEELVFFDDTGQEHACAAVSETEEALKKAFAETAAVDGQPVLQVTLPGGQQAIAQLQGNQVNLTPLPSNTPVVGHNPNTTLTGLAQLLTPPPADPGRLPDKAFEAFTLKEKNNYLGMGLIGLAVTLGLVSLRVAVKKHTRLKELLKKKEKAVLEIDKLTPVEEKELSSLKRWRAAMSIMALISFAAAVKMFRDKAHKQTVPTVGDAANLERKPVRFGHNKMQPTP